MVLPLTCTVNCEAPITVARMRSSGSTTGRVTRGALVDQARVAHRRFDAVVGAIGQADQWQAHLFIAFAQQ